MKKNILYLLIILFFLVSGQEAIAQSGRLAERMREITRENNLITQKNLSLAETNLAHERKIKELLKENYINGKTPVVVNTKYDELHANEAKVSGDLEKLKKRYKKLEKDNRYLKKRSLNKERDYKKLVVKYQELIKEYEKEKLASSEIKEKFDSVYDQLIAAKDSFMVYKVKYVESEERFKAYKATTEMELKRLRANIAETGQELNKSRANEKKLKEQLAMIQVIYQIRNIKECKIEFTSKSEGMLYIEANLHSIQEYLEILSTEEEEVQLTVKLMNVYEWHKANDEYRKEVILSDKTNQNRIGREAIFGIRTNFDNAYIALNFKEIDGKKAFKDKNHLEFKVAFYLTINGNEVVRLEELKTLIRRKGYSTSLPESDYFQAFSDTLFSE